ncbi:hypothetical protein G6F68_018038 [Rhizopus microsporus]|nr:hypothetical protein G6F68_018038 [Rhizopus microsporus]
MGDGPDAAIRRLLAQQAGERQPPAGIDLDGVRRAYLRVARAFGAALVEPDLLARKPAQPVGLGTRHQPVVVGHVVVVGHDHAATGIDGHAAPVRAAVVAGVFDGMTITARRCVEAFVVRLAELDAADQLVDRGQPPHVALGQVMLAAKRVVQREQLGG